MLIRSFSRVYCSLIVLPAVALFILATVAQAQPARQAAAAVSVNGSPIDAALIEQGMGKALEAGLPNSAATRELVEAELIAREVLRQEARRQGLDKHAEVELARREAGDAAMVRLLMLQHLRHVAITDDEVRQRYQQTVASLGPVEYKARVIAVGDEVLARRLHAESQRAPQQFSKLATQYSQDGRAIQGGEMEWVSFPVPVQQGKTQQLPTALADVIAKLQPGQIAAAPVLVDGTWYVVKLDAMRPTVVPAYDQAKSGVRALLERQRTEQAAAALIAKLVGGARIERQPR